MQGNQGGRNSNHKTHVKQPSFGRKKKSAAVAEQPMNTAPVIGQLTVRVKNAKDLKDMETLSKNDVYVQLSMGGVTKKTETKNNAGRNAEWDRALFTFDVREGDSLLLEAYDEDPGKTCVCATSYYRLGYLQWSSVHPLTSYSAPLPTGRRGRFHRQCKGAPQRVFEAH